MPRQIVLTSKAPKPPATHSQAVKAAGLLFVSGTALHENEEDFPGMNEEWLRWFPSNPPARQGAKLRVKVAGLKVSIAAIAEA